MCVSTPAAAALPSDEGWRPLATLHQSQSVHHDDQHGGVEHGVVDDGGVEHGVVEDGGVEHGVVEDGGVEHGAVEEDQHGLDYDVPVAAITVG